MKHAMTSSLHGQETGCEETSQKSQTVTLQLEAGQEVSIDFLL